MADATKFINKLRGSRVLIVGGSSGIGFAVAEGAVEHGAVVHIASSSPERVEGAVKKLVDSYPSAQDRIKGHVVALGDKESIESNVKALLAAVGEIDHLVHTAGDIPTPPAGPEGKAGIFAATIDTTIAVGMVRLFAAQILIKHVVDYMPKTRNSSITVTSGSQAERPMQGYSWATSIAVGVQGLARGAAFDLAPIRVNSVTPGPVATPIFDRFPEEQRQAMQKAITARCLTGAVADPIDTAEAYLFILRDRSVTGSNIHTDSGMLLT